MLRSTCNRLLIDDRFESRATGGRPPTTPLAAPTNSVTCRMESGVTGEGRNPDAHGQMQMLRRAEDGNRAESITGRLQATAATSGGEG